MDITSKRYVPEYRRETFKGSRLSHPSDSERRKRRDAEIRRLRRSKRDQKMARTRSIATGMVNDSENEEDHDESTQQREDDDEEDEEEDPLGNIDQLRQQLWSSNLDEQYYGIQTIRDVLSNEDPPIDKVLQHEDLLSRMVELLDSSDSNIQFEAAWAVTNVASGTSEQTKALVDVDGIPALVRVVKSSIEDDNSILANQVIWALGNIAGEHWQYRDWILDLDIVPSILSFIKHLPPDQNVTWALTNLCRGAELENKWGKLRPLVPGLRSLLYMGENSGVSDTAWALYGLCTTIKEPAIQIILQSVISDLCKLLDYRSVTVRIPVLRTIGAVMDTPQRIDHLYRTQGILSRCETILTDPNCTSLHQDAYFVLSSIAQNGTITQVSDMLQRGIVYILRAMSSGDIPTRIEACSVVRNALMHKDMTPQLAQLNLVDKGVIPSLCRQLEPTGDNLILKLCLESLRQVLKNGAVKMTDGINVLAVYIEQLNGVDKLNNVLDNSRNSEIYELACNLLDVYFSDKSNQF